MVEIIAESIMDRSATEVTEIKPDDKPNISHPSIQMHNMCFYFNRFCDDCCINHIITGISLLFQT